MKTLLTSTAAIAFVVGTASASFACSVHSAGHDNKMTVAESSVENDESAMTTFDPDKVEIEKEEAAE